MSDEVLADVVWLKLQAKPKTEVVKKITSCLNRLAPQSFSHVQWHLLSVSQMVDAQLKMLQVNQKV